jgi:uncharacterized RDD family membrane protein YckC
MNEDNPYAPPTTDLTGFEDILADSGLADRGTRFVAAFVDGIIGICYEFPILFGMGYWKYLSARQEPPVVLTIAASVASFTVFLLVHGYFLKKNGQTVGKKLLGIRIADLHGNVPDYAKVILLR